MDVYRKSFSFHSTRYEEWMNGQCINGDLFETDIVAEAYDRDIHFYISNTAELNINSNSSFEFEDESTELILDRIIYNHSSYVVKPNEPVECQLFREILGISRIRFTTSSPLRVLEFYGHLTKVGQAVHRHNTETRVLDANKIIQELERYEQLSVDNLLSVAVKELEKCDDPEKIDDLKSIASCLQLFIEVYSLIRKEHQDGTGTPIILPKVYYLIAFCNYRIGNLVQAYKIANAGYALIDAAIKDSCFIQLPNEMLGGDDLKTLIAQIVNDMPGIDKRNYENEEVDPSILDTGILDSIIRNKASFTDDKGFDVEEIDYLLEHIATIQESLDKLYHRNLNKKVLDAKRNIEKYKHPCYYAWYCVHNKIHQDILTEGTGRQDIKCFCNNIYESTKELLKELNGLSPFAVIMKKDDITYKAISLFSKVVRDIDKRSGTEQNFAKLLFENESQNPEFPAERIMGIEKVLEELSLEISHLKAIGDILISPEILNRESPRVPDILPEVLIFSSNEHQRYEGGKPVMGLQRCRRTIHIEINRGDIEEYLVKPDDGFIVRIFNDAAGTAQMSAKPMRIYRRTDSIIELRGYRVHAMTPFGWQEVDYSSYSFLVFFNNGNICQCAMCMLDRGVIIVYRQNQNNKIE